jgi:hypothetical protein
MHSLRERAKDGKGGKRLAAGGKSKMKKKFMMMDLDNEDDDDEGDEGVMEKEKKFHEQLEKVLTRCQLCGPTKFCHISRTGQHVNLSFQQRRGWAVSLVSNFTYLLRSILNHFPGSWNAWSYPEVSS